jgi:hypothetical protein
MGQVILFLDSREQFGARCWEDMNKTDAMRPLGRKPHAGNTGYVCELKNRRTGIGHVVIYDKNLGFDADTEHRYVIVCETHHTLTSMPSMPKARQVMKSVDFCEECFK